MNSTAGIRHLYLDLEDTVITPVTDGWNNTELINIERVKSFIAEFRPTEVHIFSFALSNTQELYWFNTWVKPRLETALGSVIQPAWTVDTDIIPMCASVMGLGTDSVSFSDASDFWSKHQSFRLCMRHMWADNRVDAEVALLDDAVFDEHFQWPEICVSGHILNINTHNF